MNYTAKILVAWAEAIGGNKKIRDWLIANDHKELGLFVFALYHNQDSRDWLQARTLDILNHISIREI